MIKRIAPAIAHGHARFLGALMDLFDELFAPVLGELRQRIAKAQNGISWLWNEQVGGYCSRDVITGQSSAKLTSASFLSFYAGIRDELRDQRLLQHLERIAGRAMA